LLIGAIPINAPSTLSVSLQEGAFQEIRHALRAGSMVTVIVLAVVAILLPEIPVVQVF